MGSSRSAFKDVALAVTIVGGVLGGLFLFTGVWPPMVVVESGSMMHGNSCPPPASQPEVCDSQVGYGKLGTIDPGDMVFVQRTPKKEDITPLAEGKAKNANERNYGMPGDVVVYFPSNLRSRTPIIHRAIAYVEVSGVPDPDACAARAGPGGSASYRVFWDGRFHDFGPSGIFLPSMGFGSPQYRDDNGYKPCWSGFITKGDNPITNQFPDQALGGGVLPSQPVRIEWVEGKAIGELPWFGLIKLALSPTTNYQCSTDNGVQLWRAHEPSCDNGKAVKVLNAFAPVDLWVMLGVSLLAIGVAPLVYDMHILRRQRVRAEMVARGEDPGPSLMDQVRAKLEELGVLRRKADAPPPEGADPRKAFEPPQEPRAASPPAPAKAPDPPRGEQRDARPTKFERVQK